VFFVSILWIIEGVFVLTGIRLISLGIIPRTISGIPGILFSPFIHGNYEHLLSNTLPLLVVGSGLIYFYKDIAWRVLLMIWLFTGFWVWLAARNSAHIGASGLIYGFVCFLFLSGILRKDTRLLAVSFLVTFLYGSMVWGILPVDQSISWESHLFGSIAGIFCAIYFRHMGPQRPKAQWEIDEEQEALMNSQEKTDTLPPFENFHDTDEEIKLNYDYKEKKPDEEGEKSTGNQS
jgi:membrane associated rhomboid family serine protease